MGFIYGIAHVHVLDSEHYGVDGDKVPVGKERYDSSTYMQCLMVLGPVDIRREVNRVIPRRKNTDTYHGRRIWNSCLQHVKSQIRYKENPRGQSPFGIRSFTFVNLCLLGSLELGLELVTQGEQPPFRHLSYVMHIEDEDLENHDICSIPTVPGPHRQKKHQRPGRAIRDEVKL
jgi:hypothetical protein